MASALKRPPPTLSVYEHRIVRAAASRLSGLHETIATRSLDQPLLGPLADALAAAEVIAEQLVDAHRSQPPARARRCERTAATAAAAGGISPEPPVPAVATGADRGGQPVADGHRSDRGTGDLFANFQPQPTA